MHAITEIARKNWKLGLKALAIALVGAFGVIQLGNGDRLSNSNTGNLLALVLLITAVVKVAGKKAEGWLWGATAFYWMMFGQNGLAAWLYLAIVAGAIRTWWVWDNEDARGRQTSEE